METCIVRYYNYQRPFIFELAENISYHKGHNGITSLLIIDRQILIKGNHTANRFSLVHQLKRIINLFQGHHMGN